jgi:hypothetical protein
MASTAGSVCRSTSTRRSGEGTSTPERERERSVNASRITRYPPFARAPATHAFIAARSPRRRSDTVRRRPRVRAVGHHGHARRILYVRSGGVGCAAMRGQLITTLAVCNSKSATVAAAVCLPCGCTRSSSSTSNERTLTLPGPWPAQRSLPPNLIRQKRRHQLPRRPDAAGRPAGRQSRKDPSAPASRPASILSSAR